MYQLELVWNREFNYVSYGKPSDDIEKLKRLGSTMLNSGNGESVKKCQIIDLNTGEVVVKNHEIHY